MNNKIYELDRNKITIYPSKKTKEGVKTCPLCNNYMCTSNKYETTINGVNNIAVVDLIMYYHESKIHLNYCLNCEIVFFVDDYDKMSKTYNKTWLLNNFIYFGRISMMPYFTSYFEAMDILTYEARDITFKCRETGRTHKFSYIYSYEKNDNVDKIKYVSGSLTKAAIK